MSLRRLPNMREHELAMTCQYADFCLDCTLDLYATVEKRYFCADGGRP